MPLKEKCTRSNGNRTLMVPKRFIEQRQKSPKNTTTDTGIRLRINRSIQVEGAFGVLKTDYGVNRFLTRGKTSVTVEFTLLCFGYNTNNLHSKIQNERTGIDLHPLKQTA